MTEYLPLMTLLRLLAVLALVMLPHANQLPGWEVALIAGLLAWRALAAIRQWRMPSGWLRAVLAAALFAGVYITYKRIAGQVPGTALLCAMLALKVAELKARRDVMVVMFLMYFVLMTVFLHSQEIWTIGYLLLCAVAITAVLVECNHLSGPLSPRVSLRRGAAMIGQALPLMVVFFILFPRIPGPLWGLPSDAGPARTGLSDRMSPGDIASLIESDEVAFRVDFASSLPPRSQRYWRGPVFDRFDGRTWSRGGFAPNRYLPNAEIVPGGGPRYTYTVTLEPHRMQGLFALDMVLKQGLPQDSFVSQAGELLVNRPLLERRIYTLTSTSDYVLQPTLSTTQRRRALALPQGSNPEALALARRWRDEGLGASAIALRALQMFRDQPFVYTLRPPALGDHTVDEFLFSTRRGFCEHYASSFTFLMRAAGIPARVVTGYQGGEANEIGDYHVIAQSDAHAWSEIWVEGRGWVRYDPTGAVAPERIETGLASALSIGEGLPGFLWSRTAFRVYLEARWDWLNAKWNGLVLSYGPKLQQDFLRNFGLDDMRSMLVALIVTTGVILALVGAMLLRQFAPAHPADGAQRHWRRTRRKLLRAGLAQRPDEGPRDFVERVLAERPDLNVPLQTILQAYLGLRYLRGPDAVMERRLAGAVKALNP